MNLLRKVFLPTPEELQKSKEMLEELERQIPVTVNLIPDTDRNRSMLMVSEPFQMFKTDCSFCDYHIDISNSMSEGGWCTKHDINCGRGFTCKDWQGEKEG